MKRNGGENETSFLNETNIRVNYTPDNGKTKEVHGHHPRLLCTRFMFHGFGKNSFKRGSQAAFEGRTGVQCVSIRHSLY